MPAALRRRDLVLGILLLSAATSPLRAQELDGPTESLVIAWRAPAVPQMPTVTWSIAPAERNTAAIRTEARTLFDRMTTESTTYRVLFPLRNTDPFGMLYEFEYDRAEIDRLGRLEDGKSMRFAAKAVASTVHPQTKQEYRREYSGASLLTVERHETIEVPAGKFDTVVIKIEGEGVPSTPAITHVLRRYWYAPSVGWYVRHELVATGPSINQRNQYVAVKITRTEKRSDAK